jgi:hypothetical protein
VESSRLERLYSAFEGTNVQLPRAYSFSGIQSRWIRESGRRIAFSAYVFMRGPERLNQLTFYVSGNPANAAGEFRRLRLSTPSPNTASGRAVIDVTKSRFCMVTSPLLVQCFGLRGQALIRSVARADSGNVSDARTDALNLLEVAERHWSRIKAIAQSSL